MASGMDLIMLVCASAGAVGLSLLLAYGILRGAFALMRPQRAAAVKPQPEAARLS